MPGQVQKTKTATTQDAAAETPTAPVKSETVDSDKLKQELDDLLDEIEEVLEENAEEFVKGYVQKGGE
jgi:ubiquitin-like protein Pup